jgi:hypothetical protein
MKHNKLQITVLETETAFKISTFSFAARAFSLAAFMGSAATSFCISIHFFNSLAKFKQQLISEGEYNWWNWMIDVSLYLSTGIYRVQET